MNGETDTEEPTGSYSRMATNKDKDKNPSTKKHHCIKKCGRKWIAIIIALVLGLIAMICIGLVMMGKFDNDPFTGISDIPVIINTTLGNPSVWWSALFVNTITSRSIFAAAVSVSGPNTTATVFTKAGNSTTNVSVSNNVTALVVKQVMGTSDYSRVGQTNTQFKVQNNLGYAKSKSLEFGLLDNGVGVIQANEPPVSYNPLQINPLGGNVGIGLVGSLPTSTLQVNGTLTCKSISPVTGGTYSLGNSTYGFSSVYATNGVFSGSVTGATGIFNSMSLTGALTGTSATLTGAFSGTSATLSGALSGTSATFSGTLTGLSATLSGTLVVGTLTGSAPLHVQSASTFGSNSHWYDPSNYAAFIFNNVNAPSQYGLLVTDYWRSSENFLFAVNGRLFGNGTLIGDTHNPYFVVRGDGLVGIGTSAPSYNLDVSGTARVIGSVYLAGAVGIGGASSTSYSLEIRPISSTQPFLLHLTGTIHGLDGGTAGSTYGINFDSTFSIPAGATSAYVVGFTLAPSLTSTSNVNSFFGMYVYNALTLTGSAGSPLLTQYVGVYINGGSLSGGGGVTSAYGLYVASPAFGTYRYSAYFGNVTCVVGCYAGATTSLQPDSTANKIVFVGGTVTKLDGGTSGSAFSIMNNPTFSVPVGYTAGSASFYGYFGSSYVVLNDNIDRLVAVYAYQAIQGGSSKTINAVFGILVESPALASATVTNLYGLYVATQSGATNNYAAYFGGKVGIGSTSPECPLTIRSTTGLIIGYGENVYSAVVTISGVTQTTGTSKWGNLVALYVVHNIDLTTSAGGSASVAIGLLIGAGSYTGSSKADYAYGLFVNKPVTGTLNYAAYFGGSVGIGTNPVAPLHVQSGSTSASNSHWYDPSNYAAFIFNNVNAPHQYGLLVADYWRDVTEPNIIFAVDARSVYDGTLTGDGHGPAFLVTGNGNVGLGTANPAFTFDVTGSGRFTGSLALQSCCQTTTSAPSLYLGYDVTNDRGTIQATYTNVANKPLMIQRDGPATYFGGVVGIGTTNPAYTLDVYGQIRAVAQSQHSFVADFTGSLGTLDSTAAPSGGLYGIVFSANLNVPSGLSAAWTNVFVQGAHIQPWVICNSNTNTVTATLTAIDLQVPTGIVVNNVYNLYVSTGTISGQGTVTNAWGIYVQAPVYGTNKYAAYFGGAVSVTGAVTVTGTIYATQTITQNSDSRLKTNVTVIDNALEKLTQLSGITFDWRADDYPELYLGNQRQIGMIAQDVEAVFPEAVITSPNGFKAVNYNGMIAPVIEGIKQLNANATALQADNLVLHQTINSMNSTLTLLTSLLCSYNSTFCL